MHEPFDRDIELMIRMHESSKRQNEIDRGKEQMTDHYNRIYHKDFHRIINRFYSHIIQNDF